VEKLICMWRKMMVRLSRRISTLLTTPGRAKKHYSLCSANEIRDIEILKEIEILPGGWETLMA
jgi:hypothetical protein